MSCHLTSFKITCLISKILKLGIFCFVFNLNFFKIMEHLNLHWIFKFMYQIIFLALFSFPFFILVDFKEKFVWKRTFYDKSREFFFLSFFKGKTSCVIWDFSYRNKNSFRPTPFFLLFFLFRFSGYPKTSLVSNRRWWDGAEGNEPIKSCIFVKIL